MAYYYGTTISEGTYRVKAQLRIDGEYGTQYVIGADYKVTVDGAVWTVSSVAKGDTNSYVWADSPEIAIELTGISEAEVSGEATAKEIYTIDGIRHPQLQLGWNIVRMSDGTTRKIFCK